MNSIDIEKFAPVGTQPCQGKCDRHPIKIGESVKIVCFGCERIVMELKKP
jgi:hypothetical protein